MDGPGTGSAGGVRALASALGGRPGRAASTVKELGPGPSPESVFGALRGRDGVFFLDSAGGPSHLARWSFLGAEPFLVLEADRGEVTESGASFHRRKTANPFAALREALGRYSLERGDSPLPFTAGAVGYLGYDLKHAVERLPARALRDQSFPDMHLAFYDGILAHDGETGNWYATAASAGPGEGVPPGRRIDELCRVLDDAAKAEATADGRGWTQIERLSERSSPSDPRSSASIRGSRSAAVVKPLRPNMERKRYLAAVERVKEYIAAGDIFQANFTQRFETAVDVDPRELYLHLRRRNPSPFAAFLDAGGGRAVLGSSPERFLRLRGRDIETRPIKGTRPRGVGPLEDKASAEELLASAKDAAELAMIVDLERNDLGRVADYGSVRVAEARTLEAYPTVFHLVATVVGELTAGRDAVDLIKASFPGGSITGAPKVRAMEIIEELEPTARSVYTGGLGWLDLAGDTELNIVIRTMLYDRGRVTYQVGGGIVTDSDPEAEYAECLAKGRALAEVLGGEGPLPEASPL
ncbi:MAG: aminodeoxychorismate synthase component I [Planctomycetota bacterium]